LDCSHGSEIGFFSSGWIDVRIQYIPYPDVLKVCYWYGGDYYDFSIAQGAPNVYPRSIVLSSGGGTVQYDNVQIYDPNNFKIK